MNLDQIVSARRSVRAFTDKPVPRDEIEHAIQLAVQAPAPHHSAPWRFLIFDSGTDKRKLIEVMGTAWRRDLSADGHSPERVQSIVGRSDDLLSSTPALVVCCADLARAHDYYDDRRRRAEWSLFAHSVGAALQTLMLALAEAGVSSCWISAPVFCGDDIKNAFDLDARIEPHALILVGYASPDYRPRPRPTVDIRDFIIGLR